MIVQKFGGTSTNSYEKRDRIQAHMQKVLADGQSVAAVVSAMGRRGEPYATDTLLDLVLNENPNVSLREMDAIAVCGEHIAGAIIAAHLQKAGVNACYLTGQQAGIMTDGRYTDAELDHFDPSHIRELMAQGFVPLIGSSQGGAKNGEICTIGRGGGDTSAAILGVGLEADEVHIYTDVNGVMTADPRVVPNARLLEQISYRNCADMAYNGAKMVHPRAVEIAAQRPQMALYLRSLYSDDRGTLICAEESGETRPVGVAIQSGEILVNQSPDSVLAQACLAEKIELIPVHAGRVDRFAIADKDVRRFNYLLAQRGERPDMLCGLIRVSLIGDHLDQADDTEDRMYAMAKGGVAAARLTSGSCSIWVDGHGEETLIRAHREFLEH